MSNTKKGERWGKRKIINHHLLKYFSTLLAHKPFICTHRHTRTHTNIQIHTHRYPHTHTHTHRYPHTQIPLDVPLDVRHVGHKNV